MRQNVTSCRRVAPIELHAVDKRQTGIFTFLSENISWNQFTEQFDLSISRKFFQNNATYRRVYYSVHSAEILSHTFLTKIPSKRRFYWRSYKRVDFTKYFLVREYFSVFHTEGRDFDLARDIFSEINSYVN